MITYQITRFIHSVIRSNKLVHLVDALLEQSHEDENILDDLIFQFKRFLQKGNDEIFEENRLKYVTYLDDFNTHIADIKDLSKKDAIEINGLLLEIYEIPKKRNNLLSGILFYFYLKNHRHLQGKAIFKVIYLYFLIITYRNRLSDSMRANIITIDNKRLRPISAIFAGILHRLQRRRILPSSRSLVMMGALLGVTFLSIASWRYGPITSHLQADVTGILQDSGVSNDNTIGKIALGTLMIGSMADKLQGFDFQNILIVALLAVIFQSLRTGFTNLFVNSFLVKTFAVIGTILKIISRVVFSVYNYAIYKISTRYIFTSIDFIISRGILPGRILIALFLLLYVCIYISVIAVYFFLTTLFFTMSLVWWQVVGIIILTSLLLIGINLHADVENFRAFLIEIETIFKSLHEAVKADEKKELGEVQKA